MLGMGTSYLPIMCILAIFVLPACGFDDCALNPQTNFPLCNDTLHHGHCVRPYGPVKSRWCHWAQKDFDVCCAADDSECCAPSTAIGGFVLTMILLSLVTCCCCCVGFSRIPPPTERPRAVMFVRSQPHTGMVQQTRVFGTVPTNSLTNKLLHKLGLRSTSDFERQQTGMSDATTATRATATSFVFPKLAPVPGVETRECIVCFEESRTTVLPCGHCLLCEECAKELLRNEQPCPNCRKAFDTFAVVPKQPTFRDLDAVARGGNGNVSPTSSSNNSVGALAAVTPPAPQRFSQQLPTPVVIICQPPPPTTNTTAAMATKSTAAAVDTHDIELTTRSLDSPHTLELNATFEECSPPSSPCAASASLVPTPIKTSVPLDDNDDDHDPAQANSHTKDNTTTITTSNELDNNRNSLGDLFLSLRPVQLELSIPMSTPSERPNTATTCPLTPSEPPMHQTISIAETDDTHLS